MALLAGCVQEQRPSQPEVPVLTVATPTTEGEETAYEFEIQATEPLQSSKKPVMKPPAIRVSRDPFAGKAERRKPKPEKELSQAPPSSGPQSAAKPSSSTTPQLDFGGAPDYPTYSPKKPTQPAQDSNSVAVVLTSSEAHPTYHPSVKLMEVVDRPWLDVRFLVRADGTFEASLVRPTGDPILDRIILRTINRWKWEPRMVEGQAVPSTVVLRLKRKLRPGFRS